MSKVSSNNGFILLLFCLVFFTNTISSWFLSSIIRNGAGKNGKFSDGLETLYFIELLEQHNIFTDNGSGNKFPKKHFKICGVIQFQGGMQISLGGWENFLRGAKNILWRLPTLSMIWFIF
jgi:hypothetical protein